VHGVPVGAGMNVHVLISQALVRQSVPVAGQSCGPLHPTQLPLPSQTVPPLSAHGVPCPVLASAQAPFSQMASEQVVPGLGQSVAGFTHAPPDELLIVAKPPGPVAPMPLLLFVDGAPPVPLAPVPEEVVSRTTLPPQAAITDDTRARKSKGRARMAAA
jgi:hypothetical protein